MTRQSCPRGAFFCSPVFYSRTALEQTQGQQKQKPLLTTNTIEHTIQTATEIVKAAIKHTHDRCNSLTNQIIIKFAAVIHPRNWPDGDSWSLRKRKQEKQAQSVRRVLRLIYKFLYPRYVSVWRTSMSLALLRNSSMQGIGAGQK